MNTQGFFWFCSGAVIPLLKKSPSDHVKYAGIGATVFFTCLFAALSGGYALYFVFNDLELTQRLLASAGFALLWGAMIFNLDRYIVSSMKKKNGIWSELRMALPRFVLAAVIAVVISKPLELQIFHTSIETELEAMQQIEMKRQEELLYSRYAKDIDILDKQIQASEQEIRDKTSRRDQLEEEARKEADGTGGSQKRGAKIIYKIKRSDADKAQFELESAVKKITPIIGFQNQELKRKRLTADSVKLSIKRGAFDGFDKRLQALGIVTEQNSTLALASWFLMALFITIELCPVLVKLLSPRGPYDDLLEKHEHAVEIYRIEQISSLNQHANLKIQKLRGILPSHQTDQNIKSGPDSDEDF